MVLGTPTEEDLTWLPSRCPARNFIKKVPHVNKQSWKSICPKATDAGIEALERMLAFNPMKRATVSDCLLLPYYETLHMPHDEPTSEIPVDWAFDEVDPTRRNLQKLIYAECCKFYPEIAQRDGEKLQSDHDVLQQIQKEQSEVSKLGKEEKESLQQTQTKQIQGTRSEINDMEMKCRPFEEVDAKYLPESQEEHSYSGSLGELELSHLYPPDIPEAFPIWSFGSAAAEVR
eukprot:Skav213811  [mRNA]  locus=scaffold1987:457945:458637:- [translate_table: standard]